MSNRQRMSSVDSCSMESLEPRKLLSASPLDLEVIEPQLHIGLLLPAVQKVQEAAERTAAVGELRGIPEDAAALLLPAVQKVRDAAARHDQEEREPNEAALLLPAVQKVQEAAERTQEIADLHELPSQARIGLLLPAVQKVSAR